MVTSQPVRLPLPWVPGVLFRVPKVPEVSRAPLSPLICEAKKFVAGLLAPETEASVPVEGPNRIWSPVMPASPSMADTIRRALMVPDAGVQNPDTEEIVETEVLVSSAPTKIVMFLAGREGFP